MRNTLTVINFLIMIKKLIAKKNPRCNIFYLVIPRMESHNNTHKNSDVTACCVFFFVKREVHRCDCLQFLIHSYSQVLFIGSFNFNFSSQYVLLGLYRALLVISCIILLFRATNLCFLFWYD